MDRRHGAAFTLIELLVVIIIIAIIISITLPALGLARTAAKKAATDGMMRQITNAAATFQNDNRRMPGYFTAQDMGSNENETMFGMSAMQNVMLDLAGFQMLTGGTMVGPTAATQMAIDPKSLGLPGQGNNKAYWLPDASHLVAQDSTGQQKPDGTSNAQLPSVVDQWGDPILAWVADDTALGKVNQFGANGFARFAAKDTSSNTPPGPSLFYWASNACFLSSDNFGKRGQNNATNSMIGSTVANTGTAINQSLAGVLGNPNFPTKDPMNPTDAKSFVPSVPRGPFILQSAGADGVIASNKDRGAKQFAWGYVDYTYSFVPDVNSPISASNQWTDTNGNPKNIDVMTRFDDLLAVGGN